MEQLENVCKIFSSHIAYHTFGFLLILDGQFSSVNMDWIGKFFNWIRKLSNTHYNAFGELSNWNESSLIELESSWIELESSWIELESSPIELESSLI